ncbi:hypothetical protein [Candidatus Viridilinea mediisalina]|uniref:Uncharacterized protein n=1 Tax=Candidatus Viridilinea mediisalina TaxID=2024553 RepID=A0A2A6RIH6_9CHLR|nr:hypothetical protein [Candidatus Viridilinea mediisalina]PDW02822.1 hypothetical protein CJ255_12135 [Candidatus Viridilinea mediisalina]
MNVLKRQAFLLKVNHLSHNAQAVVRVTVTCVQTGREVAFSLPDLSVPLQTLLGQLGFDAPQQPRRRPMLWHTKQRQRRRRRRWVGWRSAALRVRSNVRSGMVVQQHRWLQPASFVGLRYHS